MTEAEWLACEDPQVMLRFLRGKVHGRKVRLFACACVRRIWFLLRDERSRAAVEAAERYADRQISGHELERVYSNALNVYMFLGMARGVDLRAPRAAFCCASRECMKEAPGCAT